VSDTTAVMHFEMTKRAYVPAGRLENGRPKLELLVDPQDRHLWAGRAGPVQRLVTHARGRAYGFLAAILCQLGIMLTLLFAK